MSRLRPQRVTLFGSTPNMTASHAEPRASTTDIGPTVRKSNPGRPSSGSRKEVVLLAVKVRRSRIYIQNSKAYVLHGRRDLDLRSCALLDRLTYTLRIISNFWDVGCLRLGGCTLPSDRARNYRRAPISRGCQPRQLEPGRRSALRG